MSIMDTNLTEIQQVEELSFHHFSFYTLLMLKQKTEM